MRFSTLLCVGLLLVHVVHPQTAFPQAGADPFTGEITRGPYLQALLSDSVVIVWQTRNPSTGAVTILQAGDVQAGGGERTVAEVGTSHAHRVKLDGLTPGTEYFYDVLADADILTEGEGFRFRTAPLPGEGVARFLAIGDSGSGSAEQLAVAELLCELRPDVLLHTGDIDYTGRLDDTLFAPYREVLATSCFFAARGNHDLAIPWDELFILPGVPEGEPRTYYSFDWGSAHFAVLDSNAPFPAKSEAQLAWLEEDLAAARDNGQSWVILMLHKPPYTVGLHHRDLATHAMREQFAPIADRFEVDLVLAGHDHNYQRSPPIRGDIPRDAWQTPNFISPQGTTYIVTGGGGQILYTLANRADMRYNQVFAFAFHLFEMEVTPTQLTGRALGIDQEVLDVFTIQKNRPRPVLEFLRGDANYDGRLELVDAVRVLLYLFAAEPMECPAVGTMQPGALPNITSPLFVLNFLFLGGPPVPAPYPSCGPAPNDDDGFCTRSGCGA